MFSAECDTCTWAASGSVEYRINDRADDHELANPEHRVTVEGDED